MTGAVGRIAGAAHRSLAELVGVAAKGSLGDFAFRRAVEGQATVFQVVDDLDGFLHHDLHRVLVGQVIAALYGVEHVPFPVVLVQVAERGPDAALSGARVRPHRVELADDGRLCVLREMQGGHQAGPSTSHDYGVIALRAFCHSMILGTLVEVKSIGPACVPYRIHCGLKVTMTTTPSVRNTAPIT